ncbi:MAG: hypothetical protein EXR07_17950, partial [Acetobacteraceae bacterium]|nr:hypothetical protein [Acetobacteraceae bacterium]
MILVRSLSAMTTFNVTSGQTISGVTLNTGDFALVSSGGTAKSLVLKDGSALDIFSGGTASGTVMSGGSVYVFSGGVASGTVMSNGFEYVSSGGVASATVVRGGTVAISAGGTASFTVVSSAGSEAVYGGGLAIATVLSGGLEAVYSGGTASATVVSSGASEFVYSSGLALSVVVSSGGSQTLYPGGIARGTIVRSLGSQVIFTSGTASGTVVSSGGFAVVSKGGSLTSGVVSSGGVAMIFSGGTASFTAVSRGGTIDLPDLVFSSGGTVVPDPGSGLLSIIEGGNTIQLQLAGTYTGEFFQVAADTGTGTLLTLAASPRSMVWTGSNGTSFANATDWNDITNSLNPALSAPDSADTAQFLTIGGAITGAGTAAVLQFGGAALWNVTSGANLNAASSVIVGTGGGELLINGGASINGLGTSDQISNAAATVDGAGSAWKSTGELFVGTTGIGNLTISNSASLAAAATASLPALVLGSSSGGDGTLLVTGTGSRATLVGQLNVGQAGGGHLRIAAQGTVLTGGATLAPSQGIEVGQSAGAAGDITVTGTQSLLSNTGQFIVGDAGFANLSILAGGTVITAPGTIAGLAGGVIANTGSASGSSVSVIGAGSNWQVTGTLVVGNAGFGSLAISQSGSVTASALTEAAGAGGGGIISVSGTGSALTLTGSLSVGGQASGGLSILNGATVTAASAQVGNSASSSGNIDIEGVGSRLIVGTVLNVGGVAGGKGVITVGVGAELKVGATIVTGVNGILNNLGGTID